MINALKDAIGNTIHTELGANFAILKRIQEEGGRVYLVGGTLRDLVWGHVHKLKKNLDSNKHDLDFEVFDKVSVHFPHLSALSI